ncbi:hypothetical protein [Hydrogenophaga sp. PBL-H3]|uniref:hypothetical protein n=1 Tax=Hydrogenophaga sp. PBL-H3 TaxID=434010 RepID=UPI0013203AFC|nr:hypothetical protein [Hydrogenophaga sp. PBL-H3]QHE76788.1 hypothetical protein F9Z45_12320 [Hydrogenophaga sp. PBL-H3]QHE81212.1 hypothetical protein F9Z44_12320 [Hydrogenophaga sp. PBL-H3]
MSTPTLHSTPLTHGTHGTDPRSFESSKTEIHDGYTQPRITKSVDPNWGEFNQILVPGSTQVVRSNAQAQRTLPISKEEKETVAFKLLEAWTGRVEHVDTESGVFDAQVSSEHQAGILENAQFNFEEISEDDLDLIKPGALFYWSVGYRVDKFGRRSTESSLRFKRGKIWTRKQNEQLINAPLFDLEWLKSDLAPASNDPA